jgi:hypothetical protein
MAVMRDNALKLGRPDAARMVLEVVLAGRSDA